MTTAYRVSEVWQLADVYYIRRQTKIHGHAVDHRMEFDEDFNEKYHYILLAQGDDPIGTCRVNFEHQDYGKIERVAILDQYQHQGFGRELISAAEDWLEDKGFAKVVITSVDTAVGFYEKLGYTPNYEIKYEDTDFPIVYMAKQFKSIDQREVG